MSIDINCSILMCIEHYRQDRHSLLELDVKFNVCTRIRRTVKVFLFASQKQIRHQNRDIVNVPYIGLRS